MNKIKAEPSLVAPEARYYEGQTYSSPFKDGVLTLDSKGLKFIDNNHKEIFKLMPSDVKSITLRMTDMTVRKKDGTNFVLSLSYKQTGIVRNSALLSVGSPVASVWAWKAQKDSHLMEWRSALKTYGYNSSDFMFGKTGKRVLITFFLCFALLVALVARSIILQG